MMPLTSAEPRTNTLPKLLSTPKSPLLVLACPCPKAIGAPHTSASGCTPMLASTDLQATSWGAQ